tara:strand:- start:92641 stop:93261 length:621 start_codon:yes stop_codon:yes gene_type:complete
MIHYLRRLSLLACLAAVALSFISTSALAEQRGSGKFKRPGHHIDQLPRGHLRVTVGKKPYFYHQGVYYSPQSRGYVVVGAPLGARVRSLPAGYVSFGIGTRRYFHVNTAYYLWDDRRRDYVVVEKPKDADQALANGTEVASAAELFVYPRNNQTEEERDQDRYECHQWARNQTGFDPSASNQSLSLAPDYQRAMSACLEGRGYTVK